MRDINIYLFESDLVLAAVLLEVFKKNGYTLKVFNKPEIFLSSVSSTPPDLIVVDYFLKQGGLDILSNLWKFKIPFIFISDYDPNVFRKKSEKVKCLFIKKPFDNDELIAGIKKLLKNHHKH